MLASPFDDDAAQAHNSARFRRFDVSGHKPAWIVPAAGAAMLAGLAAAAALLLTEPGASDQDIIAAAPAVAPALDRSATAESSSIMSGPTMSVIADGTELAEVSPSRTRRAAQPADAPPLPASGPGAMETVTSASPEPAPAPTQPDPAPGLEPMARDAAPEAATPPVAPSDASSGLDPAF